MHSHHETAALSRFIMWSPGFAALCTCWALRIPVSTLGWQWPPTRFLRLAYVLPLLYGLPVYLFTWPAVRHAFVIKSFETAMVAPYGLDRWPTLGTFGVALPLTFTITVIGTAVWALGEELGWRLSLSSSQGSFRFSWSVSALRRHLGNVALSGIDLG